MKTDTVPDARIQKLQGAVSKNTPRCNMYRKLGLSEKLNVIMRTALQELTFMR
jgi:hypothetical protein